MKWKAVKILIENKQYLIFEMVDFVKVNYPNRTIEYDKCSRDTGIVIDAYISGIKDENDMYMRRVCNSYYRNSILQLKSSNVEVMVHTMLYDKMCELIQDDAPKSIDVLTALKTMLVTTLTTGPITTPIDITTVTQKIEHCQRNWDFSKPPTSDHINIILEAAITMPTKQNRPYYRLVCSTNLEFNRLCYDNAVFKPDPEFNTQYHRNSQVYAPLLLMWTPDDVEKCANEFDDSFIDNFHLSAGISSGAAAFAAGFLGYSTGFCLCIDWTTVYKNLIQRGYPEPAYGAGLILGIGHPDDNYNYNDVVIDGTFRQTVASLKKNIMVDIIT